MPQRALKRAVQSGAGPKRPRGEAAVAIVRMASGPKMRGRGGALLRHARAGSRKSGASAPAETALSWLGDGR